MQNTMNKLSFHTLAPTLALAAASLLCTLSLAKLPPPTAAQRSTAEQVSQSGVALSELAANAPPSYTIRAGDTLWDISGLFLKSVWRWPELWGMNMADIKNPHLIYPGQTLFLDTRDGRARLRLGIDGNGNAPGDLNTVRISPRTRIENISAGALPTLKNHLIEPFLAEPIIADDANLGTAARIVATQEGRVLLTRGDRAYARGPAGYPLQDDTTKKYQIFRVFRNATALKDPLTGEVLGYEARYVGTAKLQRSETTQSRMDAQGKGLTDIVPATIDIIAAKEEMRVGDRLLPDPPRQIQSYVPHASPVSLEARIVSVYGSAVANAAQNQVVAINKGMRDGIESGHVMAIMNDGSRLIDKTDPSLPQIKLPDERSGLLMVFLPFEKVSYALVLDIDQGVKAGDRLISPR
jgi:hypothetical protein